MERWINTRSRTNKKSGDPIDVADWTKYLKKDTDLYATGADLFGNLTAPKRWIRFLMSPHSTYDALSDVTDDTFWSPYQLRRHSVRLTMKSVLSETKGRSLVFSKRLDELQRR